MNGNSDEEQPRATPRMDFGFQPRGVRSLRAESGLHPRRAFMTYLQSLSRSEVSLSGVGK